MGILLMVLGLAATCFMGYKLFTHLTASKQELVEKMKSQAEEYGGFILPDDELERLAGQQKTYGSVGYAVFTFFSVIIIIGGFFLFRAGRNQSSE